MDLTKFVKLTVFIMAILAASVAVDGGALPIQAPRDYLLEKLHTNDMLFLGTTHKRPEILKLIVDLLPHLSVAGVTHLALEIETGQQGVIDQYLQTGRGLAQIELHAAIESPHYRRLFEVLRRLPAAGRPEAKAIDLPPDQYAGPLSRDQYMAQSLSDIVQANPRAKVLVVLGSLHVLRKLDWQTPLGKPHHSIRTYLGQSLPDLNLFSVVNIVGREEEACDFGRRLGVLPGTLAMDVNTDFTHWRLGLTQTLAIRPAQPYELIDGVIVF